MSGYGGPWQQPGYGGAHPPQQPYPPQQYPPQQYPSQQYPAQHYGPPQQYPAPQYPPQQYGPPGQPAQVQPVVIPVEGTGVAKLGARMNPRSLVIGPDGIAHEGKHGSIRAAWPELARVTITTAYHRGTGLVAMKTWRVRLILDAADPGFPQRHPEMAQLQGKYGGSGPGSYGVPLGPVPNIVQPLAQAIAAFGGRVFAGVVEEGRVIGFGYL